MRTVVLAPWRGGERWREHAWKIVEPYYRSLGHDVYVGDSGDQPFSLGATTNQLAAKAGDWDVALFIGADCVMSPEEIEAGIAYAFEHQVVTLPFDKFYSLSEGGRQRPANNQLPFEEPARSNFLKWASRWEPHHGPAGYLMMPRSVWDRIGGFDVRFKGWGYEDAALLSVAGEFHRLPGALYHYFHPIAKRNSKTPSIWREHYASRPARQYLVKEGVWVK